MNYGKRLQEIRKAQGVTQVDLAKLSGVTQAVITHYETGKRTPTLERADKLAKALGVSLDEFTTSSKVKPSSTPKKKHGNTRTAQIMELFDKLKTNDQRTVLSFVKGLVN